MNYLALAERHECLKSTFIDGRCSVCAAALREAHAEIERLNARPDYLALLAEMNRHIEALQAMSSNSFAGQEAMVQRARLLAALREEQR